MKTKFLAMIVGLTLTASGAQAAGSFGLQAGWGIPKNPEGAEILAGGFYGGVTADFHIAPSLSVGLYAGYQMLGQGEDVKALVEAAEAAGFEAEITIRQIPYGITANFMPMGTSGFYVGANLGMVTSTIELTVEGEGIDESGSDFTAGGQAGFDFPIGAAMTAGIEGRYIHIFSDDEAGYLIHANAQLKFMF